MDLTQANLQLLSITALLEDTIKDTLYKIQVHSWHTIALGSLLFSSILAFSLSQVFSLRRKTNRVSNLPKSHQALLAFITPTLVARPSNYTVLLSHSACNRSKIIRINVSLLLRNISAGTVELRNPHDLPQLFGHQLRVYGWSLHLLVDSFWRCAVLRWLLTSQLPVFKVRNKFDIFS